MYKRSKGFTLIELMITVAIVGILAAVAYPSYKEQIIRSRRTDATESLMGLAHVLERCYTSYGAYNNVNCSVVDGSQAFITQDSSENYYSIGIASTNLSATAFTLEATPKSGKSQEDDDVCKTLSLQSTGKRESEKSNGDDSSETCWKD
jgi:type IV pilus assembly protein PilE